MYYFGYACGVILFSSSPGEWAIGRRFWKWKGKFYFPVTKSSSSLLPFSLSHSDELQEERVNERLGQH